MLVIAVANVLMIAAVSFLLSKKEEQRHRPLFWSGLIIKIVAAIALGLVYTYYYFEGDTFPYFHDSVVLAELAREDFFSYLDFMWASDNDSNTASDLSFQQPRAMFLAKLASVISLVAHDNYWMIAVHLAFISFLTCWYVIRELKDFNDKMFYPAVAAFFAVPSVVFWSSGLVKETIAVAAINLIVIVFLKFWQRKRVALSWYAVLLLAVWALWNLKYYYLAVLMPVLTSAVVYRWVNQHWLTSSSTTVRVLVFMLIFIVPVGVASTLHPNFYPQRLLHVIAENHDAFVAMSAPEDLIHYNSLEGTPGSVVQNAPLALISGLFRPMVGETSNVPQLFSGMENFMILFLFFTWSYSVAVREKKERNSAGWLIILYSVVLCIFLALSTPNFGTLSRYRVGFLPWLIMMFLYDNKVILYVVRHLFRRRY